MAKVNTKVITKQLVADQNKYSFGKGNPVNYITIHQTSNWNYGAGAKGHANYQSGMSVGYGWHYQVDDSYVIQSYEDTYKVWHAGDGDGKGNTESIGIEMCVNPDSDYKTTFLNAAWLVACKMKEHNVPIERVVQHNYWTGKNCPIDIRAGKYGLTWETFIKQVLDFTNERQTETDTKIENENNTLYKVQIGAFREKGNANRMLELAKSKGFNAFISNENGLYKVQIGAYANLDNAKSQAEKAKKAGLTAYITNMVNTTDKPTLKPIEIIAKEVIRGDWGNGHTRKERLTRAGYNYDEVQREVNKLI